MLISLQEDKMNKDKKQIFPQVFSSIMHDEIEAGDYLIATEDIYMDENRKAFIKDKPYMIVEMAHHFLTLKSEVSECHEIWDSIMPSMDWVSKFRVPSKKELIMYIQKIERTLEELKQTKQRIKDLVG